MADKYPWGNQAPATMLNRLEKQMEGRAQEKAKLIETHQARLASIELEERSIAADIRKVKAFVEKERREQSQGQAMKLFEKVLATNPKLDIEAAVADGSLERLLESLGEQITADRNPGRKSRARKAETEAVDASEADEMTEANPADGEIGKVAAGAE